MEVFAASNFPGAGGIIQPGISPSTAATLPGGTPVQRIAGQIQQPGQQLASQIERLQLATDPATKLLRIAEMNAALKFEAKTGKKLIRNATGATDYIGVGSYLTYEVVGPVPSSQFFNFASFTSQITSHLGKANRLIVDLANLTQTQRAQVMEFIQRLPQAAQSCITIVD